MRYDNGPILSFNAIHRSRHNLTLLYRCHELVFTTTLWYPSVDFHELEDRFGTPFMEKLYAHILLFHGLKIQSLLPARLDLGPVAPHWTPALESLWKDCTLGCLAQWRHEVGRMAYHGAETPSPARAAAAPRPITLAPGTPDLLVGNGGGKDSLVMLRSLDAGAVDFDTVAINFHTDADPAHQMALNEAILTRMRRPEARRHRQYVMESFLNSPAAALHGIDGLDIPHIRNDEDTPNGHGVLGLLPIMLQHGYTELCFGNERSADSENTIVDGEPINHAWAKTVACERLYETYIRETFIANFRLFSLLKPLSDVRIHRLLDELAEPGDIGRLYSCNIDPPWCRRCPKCAYVWLTYRAFLSARHTAEIETGFGTENLFDVPELRVTFRRLMGAEDDKPFECVGEVDEVRIAFELCRRKGMTGGAIDDYQRHCPLDAAAFDTLWHRYDRVDPSYERLPDRYRALLQTETLAACRI